MSKKSKENPATRYKHSQNLKYPFTGKRDKAICCFLNFAMCNR